MKILIWILCLIIPASIKTLLDSNGIILGAIPTVLLWVPFMWLARHLCRKLDKSSAQKTRDTYNATLGRIASKCNYCGFSDNKVYDYCPKCSKYGMEYTYYHTKETLRSAVELALAGRASLSNQTTSNWDDEIEQCWKTEIDILSSNVENSIFYFQHDCTVENLYWISEVIDVLIEKTQSRDLLFSIEERFRSVDEQIYSIQKFHSTHIRDYVTYDEYFSSISEQIEIAKCKLNNH